MSSLTDNERLKKQLGQLDEKFYSDIKEILLEREHNMTFINGLRFKTKIDQMNEGYPLALDHGYSVKSNLKN
jgi:hypothetical protein